MKQHTSKFKEEIKKFGRELDSKITYELDGVKVELGSEELNSITPHYEGTILKSVMKQLDIDSNVEIPLNTILNYQLGVKVNDEYEYLNFGNYVVYKSEKQEDTSSYKITCYDKMLYSMVDYENMNITYPITIRDYIGAICNKLGLTFKNASDTFANYNRIIQTDLYEGLGYTIRDVLDELAQVTASTICINEEDDELEVRYINDTGDTIDGDYLKNINVNFGEKYGPVNSIVLSRSAESDNVYLQDENSVSQNGLCEIKIKDNQIMNFNDRSDYLPDILYRLDGLEYYLNDFASTGITYYNLCDRYTVQIDDMNYSCVMFNDEINITQGLEENVYTEMPEESVTNYTKSDTTDRRINQAFIIVKKQQGEIEALISEQTEQGTKLSQTIQNVSSIHSLFQITGGSNLIKNSQFLLPDKVWEITKQSGGYCTELGEGYNSSLLGKTTSLSNIILRNASIVSTNDNITGLKINQTYTLHLYYTLEEYATGHISLIGANNGQVVIDESYSASAEMQEITIQFTAYDTDYTLTIDTETTMSGSFIIYDLMLNSGDKKNWEPAMSEVYSTVLKMSQLGLQIYASGARTLTLMSSMGFGVYKSNNGEIGEIVTDFTDEGIETNKVNSKEIRISDDWVVKSLTLSSKKHLAIYKEGS